jgi:hypothetical protein
MYSLRFRIRNGVEATSRVHTQSVWRSGNTFDQESEIAGGCFAVIQSDDIGTDRMMCVIRSNEKIAGK